MKLGTVRSGEQSRAFRQDGSGRTFYYDLEDVGSLLNIPDWERLPSREGEPPAPADLLAPVARPGKTICVGLNYFDHAAEVGKAAPEVPALFSKVSTALTGPRNDIRLPGLSMEVDWEAELAVVIGKRTTRADEAQAREAVAGYTIINDLSIRDWQRRTSEWFQGKNFDHSTPVGPVIVSPDEIDPESGLRVETLVNDQIEQSGTTSDLIFSVTELVRYISQVLTLEPGDIIATGTPGGVGFVQKPPCFLQTGDVLRTRIEGIGELCNTIQIGNDQSDGPARNSSKQLEMSALRRTARKESRQ
ncbi:acylpyruvate hydrolase [Arthrobacter sp. 1088]|uniref:fumarylacetoacetate hydrolase family protein n=1 Tax=Arthrobacter sp. 1088 TaxID=2817768 RepID=UPI002865B91E|nr:fumarylacetoacetate hydrolase family protein [Arthrobacter sp. 1088]MDR6688931.1 acylpyruvate hydrolase [Arthrobacter sp. 1088]